MMMKSVLEGGAMVDTACRATQLTFKELFDDLAQYITDSEQRWKHVMRVKRYDTDVNGLGGYGGDQCYLEGQSVSCQMMTTGR